MGAADTDGAGGVTTNCAVGAGDPLASESPADWRRDNRSSEEEAGMSEAGLFRKRVWTKVGLKSRLHFSPECMQAACACIHSGLK